MSAICKPSSLIALLASVLVLALAPTAEAQYRQRRYQPSRPTVSPYLNLFRINNNVIPNYQSLVRPEQEALRFRQEQLQLDQQRQRELSQLQSNVNRLEQAPLTTPLVAPTGKGSWFNVQGGSQFGDTRGYFSKAGSGAQ